MTLGAAQLVEREGEDRAVGKIDRRLRLKRRGVRRIVAFRASPTSGFSQFSIPMAQPLAPLPSIAAATGKPRCE